ncbi:bi-domain-containing oxidoreductase [Candidatus Pelagibacter sp.]|nr:bi-domain-containing oxidoreductase [Candidatus Pelagibacter sp.]
MKQILQNNNTGKIKIEEVPIPQLQDNFIIVQNLFSLISSGTEKTKIELSKKNLLQKAKARPDLVQKVLKKLKTDGIMETFNTVKSKLDTPVPLGYSTAGKVLSVGGHVKGISPGDLVACAGAGYANHAEVITVPINLVSKIPNGVTLEEASFTTLGAIALQGCRLSKPLIGETFLVIGQGLIGQLASQILNANGCRVIASDLNDNLINYLKSKNLETYKSDENLEKIIEEITDGNGVDGVLICAGSTSNSLIELAGRVTREKGRVVVVGAVKMDIPREDYYKKEIEIIISRSYGPGRYDPYYEEKGNDYPLAYVRFTEKRNMETFLSLINQKKINVKELITHEFLFSDVNKAYDLLNPKNDQFHLGILLKYQDNKFFENKNQTSTNKVKIFSNNKISLSLIGAGNYAKGKLLPILKSDPNVEFNGIVTNNGSNSLFIKETYNFLFNTSNIDELLDDKTNAIMITTLHNTHSDYVVKSLNANKHVYVEKPLALNVEELKKVNQAFLTNNSSLLVGFNRNFSSLTKKVLDLFKNIDKKIIHIRVNAGKIDKDHWTQNPKIGGGRLIGEGCHFISLASCLASSKISKVYSNSINSNNSEIICNDNFNISVKFENGSIANIVYTSAGSVALEKEYIEVFGGGCTAKIIDFQKLELYQDNKNIFSKKYSSQDKGQKHMISSWLKDIKLNKISMSYDFIINTSLSTVLSAESLMTGEPVDVNLNILD